MLFYADIVELLFVYFKTIIKFKKALKKRLI